ncbi:MAG: hypothetical protein FK734_13860, partial [Asgard group archaeon]|nr:hypothetical protein [Asgard group archaeon]
MANGYIEPEDIKELDDNPEVISLKKRLSGMSKDDFKKTTDALRLEISQLSSTISQLKKKREEANSEARHFRNMRNNATDEKSMQINKLREQIESEKELRDVANEEIQKNKQLRQELSEQIKIAWAKVNDLRQKYYQMKDEVGVMPEELTNEIRELEWQQQTTSLDPDEDAKFTKRISELYEKAYTAHLIGFSSDELEKEIEKAKRLSEEHDVAHENVLKFAEKSQMHHEKMQELYKQLDKLRGTGNDLHEKYLEARRLADVSHEKIVESYSKIKLNQYLMDLMDEEQQRRRHEKSVEMKKERIEETKKKQSSSKRLTFEELK